MNGDFFPVLIALWGCRLVFSCSLFLLLPSSAPTIVFGDFAVTCNAWSTNQRMKFDTFMQYGAGGWSQNWRPAQVTLVPGMQEGSESKPERRTGVSTTAWVHQNESQASTERRISHEWARNTEHVLPTCSRSSCSCAWLWASAVVVRRGTWQMQSKSQHGKKLKNPCHCFSFSSLQTDLPSDHQAAFSSSKMWYYQWHWVPFLQFY